MTALAAAAEVVRVRVTDETQTAAFISYLERLGLRVSESADGGVTIALWNDVELAEARLEIAMAIGSWVQNHGVPVQLS